jgi:mannan endo-1,4-beta-mannosidase
MKNKLFAFFCLVFVYIIHSLSVSSTTPDNLYVQGRFLYTPCGDTITLRGANKMIIYTGDTALRRQSFAEIRKTGANCTRIVWLANPTDQEDASPAGLDRNIRYCINNNMIPMVELHDATGDWSGLQNLVDYWTSSDVVKIIQKHEKYLIINIGNEVGNEQVTNDQFKTGYKSAVSQMRNAGIHVPLVIDAAEWGKNLDMLVSTGQDIIDNDPDHNLIFSVHMYWAVSEGADSTFITNKLKSAVDANLPLIVGEFTYEFTVDLKCNLICDYQTIIKDCQDYGIGWLAWEWGPGNDYFDKSCAVMDMTSDSYFDNLKSGWASVVAESSPYSISKTSVTPKYIQLKGICDTVQSAVNESTSDLISSEIYPNPISDILNIPPTAALSASIQIFSIEGVKVLESAYNEKVDISSFSPGIYFLKSGVKLYKFVKM